MTILSFSGQAALAAGLWLVLALPSAYSQDAESAENRWPLTPLLRPSFPTVKQRRWVKNPVDAFVLARLEKAGLQPAPPADRVTLLRRVTYDLTGLAPTPAEYAAFLADTAPDAYERLVDRLLASPRFGERWAQHWLDVVRYAESDGFKIDRLRPEAYRYRDYVIRAFNDDMPYDRFVRQQLAGDELDPDNPDAVIAAGFYRLPPEDTVTSNFRQQQQEILDDVTDVFGVTFLGLTVGCARCHDHKFDPISQKDYYALQAFFTALVPRDDRVLAPSPVRQQYERRLASWNKATRYLQGEINGLLAPLRPRVFEEILSGFDADTQQAVRTPAARRTPLQQQLALRALKQIDRSYAIMYRRLGPRERARHDELQKKLAAFDARKPAPLPVAMSIGETGLAAPQTYRLAVGNYLRPREVVRPAFPECLGPGPLRIAPIMSPEPSTGRRSALARWLCQPEHPLTARVIMNRLWQHHLGRGIVATPNDFGAMGTGATHPELLDYLASELVREGWKLKAMHRLIVTSATYCQTSRPEHNVLFSRASQVDADNKLLWHARFRRRDAESIRDTALQAAGQLNLHMYGPSCHPELPEELKEASYSWDPDPHPEERCRRSVYVYARRNFPLPLLGAFDLPDRVNSCPERPATVIAPQALVLLNGPFMLAQARQLSRNLLTRHGADPFRLVRHAYRLVLNREPSAEEISLGARFLSRQARLIASQGQASGARPVAGSTPLAGAFTDFCHALLSSAEFLYIE